MIVFRYFPTLLAIALSFAQLPLNTDAFQAPKPIHGLVDPNIRKRDPVTVASVPLNEGEVSFKNFGVQRSDPDKSVLGLTENQALTYVATGSACLDLFFDVLPHISESRLYELLEAAWEENPTLSLKIIFQLGDPRNGKGDQKNFYRCLLWMYEHHFESLLLNLQHLKTFNYYKAMLDLLVLVARGRDALDDKRQRRKYWDDYNRQATHRRNIEQFLLSLPPDIRGNWTPETVEEETPANEKRITSTRKWKDVELRNRFVVFIHAQDQKKSDRAAIVRKKKLKSLKYHAKKLHAIDSSFRRLYDKIADIFVEDLLEERQRFEAGKNISGLVAKWAPSPKLFHDKQTNICEGIISRLYKGSYHYKSFQEGQIVTPLRDFFTPGSDSYKYRCLRTLYQREYLSTLRRAAEIPESFTRSGEWHLVSYKRMPSRCRFLSGKMYRRHDKERYDEYLEEAKKQAEKGERVTMVASGTLLPHEITQRAESNRSEGNEELGLQWLRLVQDVKDKGKLKNALAICDVSGSMYWKNSLDKSEQPAVHVSTALSLLVADVCEGSWSGRVVTFSQEPELVKVPKVTVDNLSSRVSFLRGIPWGRNTDFQKVFELLLEDAKQQCLQSEEMPSILFCFSDMEFDEAHAGNWKTDLELIRKKYAEADYKVPEIVFWNLRPSSSKPASKIEPGVAMLSGFSAGLLKSFMEFRLEDFNPMMQMENMLQKYDRLELAEEDEQTSLCF